LAGLSALRRLTLDVERVSERPVEVVLKDRVTETKVTPWRSKAATSFEKSISETRRRDMMFCVSQLGIAACGEARWVILRTRMLENCSTTLLGSGRAFRSVET
jgi:hypothetical protein